MACRCPESMAYDSFLSSRAKSKELPVELQATASDKHVPHLCWLQGAGGTDPQHLAPGPVNLSDTTALTLSVSS